MPKFFQDVEITYVPDPVVSENVFLKKEPRCISLPKYQDIRSRLPLPAWQGHQSAIDCYYKAWEIAFANINNPTPGTKFVSPFIDAAFNSCIFMWDSVFMLMFGKYAHSIFNFQQTLDNFYGHQHKDGFISREICEEDSSEKFTRFDVCSTGPHVMPWCEWQYYLLTGDKERVKEIFPPLLAYHHWLNKHRTWPDGGYFSSGWGSGMDNQPRMYDDPYGWKLSHSHGHMTWVDACFQMIISCNVLMEMAKICGRESDVQDIAKEKEHLTRMVNDKLWDEKTQFYYDYWPNGEVSGVKSVAGYWALLADVVPKERIAPFVAHLDNEKEFKRPNRVPTLSADQPKYCPEGDYWNGGVWAPTNYMILTGLRTNGFEALAYDIASTTLKNVVQVFEETGTLWENYAPEKARPGSRSKPNFVGWSGIFPISILFEYVFGIDARAQEKTIIWNIRLTDDFGVAQLPFGLLGTVDLHCNARRSETEKPVVQVRSNEDLTLILRWDDQEETLHIKGDKA